MPISCPIEIAPIETLDQRLSGLVMPRVSPGNSIASASETEGANVFVKTFFAQAQAILIAPTSLETARMSEPKAVRAACCREFAYR